jgi:hypothetical protein
MVKKLETPVSREFIEQAQNSLPFVIPLPEPYLGPRLYPISVFLHLAL